MGNPIGLDPQGLKVAMVCTGLLVIKFYVTIIIQGGKRFAAGSRPPEDSEVSKCK